MSHQTGDWRIDSNLFALFCAAHRTIRLKAGVRTAGQASGTSPAAISRIENRRQVSAETMLAVCLWMGANPFWFLLGPDGKRPLPAPEVDVWSRETSGETG